MVALTHSCVASVHDLAAMPGTGGVELALARVARKHSPGTFYARPRGWVCVITALARKFPVPRGTRVGWRPGLGTLTTFPQVDLLVKISAHRVPVAVDGVQNLDAALKYGNHTSIGP